jgi:hypothetical protein
VTSTAEDLGPSGYDFQHGYGVVDGCALVRRFSCPWVPIIDLCKRYPWLCGPRTDICERYPWICRGIPVPPIPPIPRIPPRPPIGGVSAGDVGETAALDPVLNLLTEAAESEDLSLEELAFLLGFSRGASSGATQGEHKGGCGCGGSAS